MRLTLPRFLGATFWIFCGTELAIFLGKSWSVLGYTVGFLVGSIGAFTLTWAILLGHILLFFPFPTCRQGRCNCIADYVWKKGTIYGWEKGGVYRYRCKCKDQYIRHGKKFMEVLPDGTRRSYKKLVGFRKWADE